ncbi:MAG: hypothetical protein RR416_03560 [Clostridia bacterium]
MIKAVVFNCVEVSRLALMIVCKWKMIKAVAFGFDDCGEVEND